MTDNPIWVTMEMDSHNVGESRSLRVLPFDDGADLDGVYHRRFPACPLRPSEFPGALAAV